MTLILTLMTNFLKNKFVFYPFVAILIGSIIFLGGYRAGYKNCKLEWDEYIQENKELNLKLSQEYVKEKQKLVDSNNQLAQEIIDNEQKYKDNISNLKSDFTDRLYESEERAKYYKSMSTKNNKTGCTFPVLADHTARLDRQLTEGIQVVQHLTELVKLRDEQLRQCGKQVELLIGE